MHSIGWILISTSQLLFKELILIYTPFLPRVYERNLALCFSGLEHIPFLSQRLHWYRCYLCMYSNDTFICACVLLHPHIYILSMFGNILNVLGVWTMSNTNGVSPMGSSILWCPAFCGQFSKCLLWCWEPHSARVCADRQ